MLQAAGPVKSLRVHLNDNFWVALLCVGTEPAPISGVQSRISTAIQKVFVSSHSYLGMCYSISGNLTLIMCFYHVTTKMRICARHFQVINRLLEILDVSKKGKTELSAVKCDVLLK